MNLEYALLTKKDIILDCGIKIKQYSIEEIENEIGYNNYEFIVWALTRYNYEFQFNLEEVGIDYSLLNSYDIFVMIANKLQTQDILKYINFIFGNIFIIENGKIISESKYIECIKNNKKVIEKINERVYIDKYTIEEIKNVLSKMFFFSKPRKRNPHNEKAKELIKKQIKMSNNKKVRYDIYSVMHSLVWSKNSNEVYETIIKKTPYQIYAGLMHIDKINKFDNTLNGLYSGIIKKDDIDFNDINWINKIK